MPHLKRGDLNFEHKTAGTIEGSEDVVEVFSCYPPPKGIRQGANPVLKYVPFQPKKFLQPEEIKRIEKFAAKPGETVTVAKVQQEIIDAFKIKPLLIDLKKVPQKWRKPDKCTDVKITVLVRSKILTINAVATKDLTLDKVTWPKGDSLANFRIIVPDQFRFRRHKAHNEKCCPLKDGEKAPEYFPRSDGWSDEQFVEYSGYDIKIELKAGYYIDPGWKKHFGGFKYTPVEPEEDEPPQPWILPRFDF